ncbi:hypothetical protein HNY73_001376 [Argiope bruennichi]|uniref:Spidroin C-terminal domain-containing protein n=1 Tax=Argiope bruennichi TaxID=94029 RepID=A0A8T0G2D2_ARGBR|nr:hypothetical protein HNY73_001376 [Argiope bruennichi]
MYPVGPGQAYGPEKRQQHQSTTVKPHSLSRWPRTTPGQCTGPLTAQEYASPKEHSLPNIPGPDGKPIHGAGSQHPGDPEVHPINPSGPQTWRTEQQRQPLLGPDGTPLQIEPSWTRYHSMNVTGPNGKPNKFRPSPKEHSLHSWTIPEPDGKPIHVEPAGPGTTPGAQTGPDGKINKLVVPTTTTPKGPLGPGGQPMYPSGPQGPGGQTTTTPIPGPDVPTTTTPKGPLGPGGQPMYPSGPQGPEDNNPTPIPGPDGKPLQIEPAGPGTTPGTVTGPDGKPNKFVLPKGAFTTISSPTRLQPIHVEPLDPEVQPMYPSGPQGPGGQTTTTPIPGPDGKPLQIEPAGPGTTSSLTVTGPARKTEYISYSSSPRSIHYTQDHPGPRCKTNPMLSLLTRSHLCYPSGPQDLRTTQTTPIPGPDETTTDLAAGRYPSRNLDRPDRKRSIRLPKGAFNYNTRINPPDPSGNHSMYLAGPGTTPGAHPGLTAKSQTLVPPTLQHPRPARTGGQPSFTTPGSIPGPDGKPIHVEPAGPGSTPGTVTGPDGSINQLFVPTTPKSSETSGGKKGTGENPANSNNAIGPLKPASTTTPTSISGPDGQPINVVPAGPGTTPGTVTGPDGKPKKFVVPQGAFTTPGSVPGPDGNPIPVEPAGPGTTPGTQTGPDGKINKVIVPTTTPSPQGSEDQPGNPLSPNGQTTPGSEGPDFNFQTPRPIKGPKGKPIQIIPAGPGTTPGTVTGRNGRPKRFVVPKGAFTTPGSIPGPNGKPIHVKPAGPGTTPGVKTGPDGSIDSIILPSTPKDSQPGFPTFQFRTPKPIKGPKGKPLQVIPAGPGTTPGVVTGPDGKPVKFIVPFGAFTTPGSIPGPNGKPIHVRPAGPGTTPGAKTDSDGDIDSIVLPSTPKGPSPGLQFQTPKPIKGPAGKPLQIIPAGPGTTPGVVTGPDGEPIEYIVPFGAFTTPGSIPGANGKPIHVKPAGPGTTPGAKTDSDGDIDSIVLPSTPKGPSPGFQFQTPRPITAPGGKPIQIVPAGPGTTPGVVTDPEGHPVKFIVPKGAFTTPGSIMGPHGKPIHVRPAGPGTTPGAKTDSDGSIDSIVLPTTPKGSGPGFQFQTPKSVTKPDGQPIQVVPAGPGTTPGVVTGPDGQPVKFIVPQGAFTTPGNFMGPTANLFMSDPLALELLLVQRLTPMEVLTALFYQQRRKDPVQATNSRPGTTPGVVTGPDGRPVKFIVPQGAFTTPGSFMGPNGKPIHVGPAGPGTTPGAKTNSDGSIDSIVLPTTPKGSGPGFQFPTPKSVTKPDGQPIQVIPAGPGTTPGVVTGPDGRPVKFIVPQGAFTTPVSFMGPNGKPIHVGPAGPGTTPGAKTDSDGNIDSIVLPRTPRGAGPGFQFSTPGPVPRPDGQPIQIVPAGVGTTPGVVTGPDGQPVKFIVPNGAFSTPGYIPGPHGKPIRVGPAGPGTTPGAKTDSDGDVSEIVLPSTPSPPAPKPVNPTTPTDVQGPQGGPIMIIPAGPGTTPGTITDPDAGPGTTPGAETGPDGKINKIILPTTPKRPSYPVPTTTTPIPGPGQPIQIVPAGPGTTPGTVTGPDGQPVKFIVPQGAFVTPGTIPGPDGKPIPVEPQGPGSTPGAELGPDGKINKIVLPTTPSNPPSSGPLNPKGEPIPPFGPGNSPNSPQPPGNYPGSAFQFPGFPGAPGANGPIGYYDFSQLPSGESPEMEGPIGFLPNFSPEIGGPFPGFPGGPGSPGPGGFLNVNSLPDFINPGYGFPGSPQDPLGYLNFSMLPPGYNPDFSGQFVYPGYPGSPGSSGQFPGGFLSFLELPKDVTDKINGTFSLPQLMQALQPLFPGQNINIGAIPKDQMQNIPGFDGNYDNLRLQNFGSNNQPTGGVFYLPELVRLVSYLPVGSFGNGPGTINQDGGFGDPFNFPGLNGAPGYICDYPDNGDATAGGSQDLGGEIKGSGNGPSGDVADAAPENDLGGVAPGNNLGSAAPENDLGGAAPVNNPGGTAPQSDLASPTPVAPTDQDCEEDVHGAFSKARQALMNVASSTGEQAVSQLMQDIISGINISGNYVDYNDFFNQLSSLLSQVRTDPTESPTKQLITILMDGLIAALEALNSAKVTGFRNDVSIASDLPVYTSFLNEILY